MFGLMKRVASLGGLRRLVAGVAIATALLPAAVSAAVSTDFTSPAVTARLISAENGIAPEAGVISVALDLELGEGWKTYWRSPGEVGIPPEVDWSGSKNLADAEILWPAPTRFRAFGIQNFGYKHEVALPFRITLERPGEPAQLNAKVNLLTCSDVCVPQVFELNLALGSGGGIDPDSAGRIAAYAAQVPDDGTASGIAITTASIAPDVTSLTVAARRESGFEAPDVFPELGPGVAFGEPDIRLGDGGRLLWAKLPILYADEDLPELRVTITTGDAAATISPALSAEPPDPPFTIQAVVPGVADVAWIALVALVGGLILNVMPCVLPVLSIKLSSAVKAGGQSHGRIRSGFLASALGVMLFMWLLAAATLLARALGLSVGWGLQFQNPSFLAVMFLILAVFAANLFGAFEIILPSSLQNRLAHADDMPGHAGDVATGAFAAVLATPCSAPFLGTAVAFALSGRPVDIFVIFTALGLGLAIPYLLVALRPGMVARMPKPGPWMVWLKVALGALLALTAAWLLSVLVGVAGARVAALVAAGTFVTVMALALGRLPGALRLGGAALVALAVVVAPAMIAAPTEPESVVETDWTPFERTEIARLVSTGAVVFVDVTADWCLTCKANKALVLEREPVASALQQPGIVPMQADWTRPDERISRYLETFGRYGIPFNVVYGPAAPEGIVLPELLSTEAVMDALAAAGDTVVAQDP